MRRRDIVTLLGSGVIGWPAVAQQPAAVARIGMLWPGMSPPLPPRMEAFRQGLSKAGYVEGRNVAIEHRWAEDRYDRLPGLAAELIRNQVAVLVAAGGPVSALAAKAATATVPVVFTAVPDPVRSGLVASFNRPGGNVTGTAGLTSELDSKRLELLCELVPSARVIGALVNPNRSGVEAQKSDVESAAKAKGRQMVIVNAGTEGDLDAAFATFAGEKATALLVTADPFFVSRRTQLLALVERHALPAIYHLREFAVLGGLSSYGPSIAEAYQNAGSYAGRILNGERPAELPVAQPTRFELAVNLKTAKALGLTVHPSLLARADEVIE